MLDALVPMTGQQPDKFLSSQKYDIDTIAHNMFSSAVRKDKKPMVPATVLKGVTIQKLWDSVFADKTDFLQRYHDRRKETNLKVGEWNYAADKGSGYRFVSLITIVDVPKVGTPTLLNEAHRFAYVTTDDNKLMIVYQISSQTPNVPAGGSFRTEAYCEITADSATTDCSIMFLGNCRKMSLAFSAIQYIATPRALREMTEAYKLMVAMIQEDLCGGASLSVDAEGGGEDKTAADANGPSVSGGGDGADGGGGGDGGAPSNVFQGVLLVLAFIVALVLMRSMMLVNRAARQSAVVSQVVRGFETGGGRPGGGSHDARGAAGASTAYPITEEQALMNAAREAQIQTLRYRWLEQRNTLSDMQSSLTTMRWMMYLQWLLIIGISVKVFFF